MATDVSGPGAAESPGGSRRRRRADWPDPTDEEARLASLAELNLLDTEPEPRFDRLTDLSARVFGVPRAEVNLIDRDRLWSKSHHGTEGSREVASTLSFCAWTVNESHPLVIEDASADDRFKDNPFVAGDEHIRFYAGHPLYGPGGYPVGALCLVDTEPRHFSADEQATLERLAHLVEREINDQDEIDRAAQVQQSLLPHGPPKTSIWEVRGNCIPARRVGGDFYDWYTVDDHLIVTVADVMGKGMSAAILAASVRAALRAETRRAGIAEAVTATGLGMSDDLDATGSFVTLFHAAFSPSGEVTFADAGHGLAVVIPADPSQPPNRLRPRGLPLGVPDGDPGSGRLYLAPGDTLVIYSDGMLELLPELDDTVTMIEALVRRGLDEGTKSVDRFVAGALLTDDITYVVVRRNAPGNPGG